jgi:D-arginine dehydrogenase
MFRGKVAAVGAGVAGLAAAEYLSGQGLRGVFVLEQERKPGIHASGRNAGMIRQAIADPLIARLARDGRNQLAVLPEDEWPGLAFRPIGSLLLAKQKKAGELRRIEQILEKIEVASCRFNPKEAVNLVSVLKGADFRKALFCPSDAVIEIRALADGFFRTLRRRRVPVFFGRRVDRIKKVKNGFEIHSGSSKFFAEKIVNAAGAWANLVAERAGVLPIPLKAYRRHIYESKPLAAACATWPFVWDLEHNFYFRYEHGGLLLSPCDQEAYEPRFGRSVADAERADRAMRRVMSDRLRKFTHLLSGVRIGKEKAGLRTISKDERFVIGEDPRVRDFYWLAALGGHGVTTGFAVGKIAGDLVLGRKIDRDLEKAFSPRRFYD